MIVLHEKVSYFHITLGKVNLLHLVVLVTFIVIQAVLTCIHINIEIQNFHGDTSKQLKFALKWDSELMSHFFGNVLVCKAFEAMWNFELGTFKHSKYMAVVVAGRVCIVSRKGYWSTTWGNLDLTNLKPSTTSLLN